MANHGVVTYGEDLLHAYMRMELVEHFARIALVTKLLGQQQLLTTQELEELAIARRKYQFAGASVTSICKRRNHAEEEPSQKEFLSISDRIELTLSIM